MSYQQKIIISRMQVVQENWQLLCTRLSDLEKQQIIETRFEERFRLKQLIKQTQEDKLLMEEELLQLEEQSKNTTTPVYDRKVVLANYHRERASFARLWAPHCSESILLLHGQSGSGKTSLLQYCRRTAPADAYQIFVDCKQDGINVAEVFNRISDRIGWDRLPEFDHQLTAHIEVNRNRIKGDGNRVSVVMNSGSLQEQNERRAQLTNALLRDVNGLDRPLLLVFDTYEKTGDDLRGWLYSVISRLPRACSRLRVVLAGQEVPDTNTGEEWVDYCCKHELKGVTEAKDWLEFAEKLGKRIPADHSLSYLTCLCQYTQGDPKQISSFIQSFPSLS